MLHVGGMWKELEGTEGTGRCRGGGIGKELAGGRMGMGGMEEGPGRDRQGSDGTGKGVGGRIKGSNGEGKFGQTTTRWTRTLTYVSS